MAYNLASLTTTANPKPFRPITPTAQQEGELFRMYTPVIQRWRDSATRMMAVYALADMAAVEEEDSNTAAEIAALLLLIRWNEFFSKVESWHRSKWIADVSRARGVDATFLVRPPVAAMAGDPIGITVQQAVSANVGLIRSVSDEARARIYNAVMGGMRRGASKDEVARQINRGLALSRNRARFIASDQMDKTVKAMSFARMDEAGIVSAGWKHTPQQHPRLHHKARDGNVYRITDPIWRELYEPNCKCQPVPVI